MEDLLEDIFRGTVATGQHCVAPSMVQTPCPSPANVFDSPQGQCIEGGGPSQLSQANYVPNNEENSRDAEEDDLEELFDRRPGPTDTAPGNEDEDGEDDEEEEEDRVDYGPDTRLTRYVIARMIWECRH